jgi:D-beta-D-heptose 7-phosphate kinase/D-beta-D-heptose 1-phosphate adenosyltransferase
MKSLSANRLKKLLEAMRAQRILVIGDAMLDQFIYGMVGRISPEAPVPVVEFQKETFMPGGAANVARNLRALGATTEISAVIGRDESGKRLTALLKAQGIGCNGLVASPERATSVKTRIIAHQQQVVRLDRESKEPLSAKLQNALLSELRDALPKVDAVIIGDYGKGVVTQSMLDTASQNCRAQGLWLSVDPKPINKLSLRGLSLITPNRKEAFELAGLPDISRGADPMQDKSLMKAANTLMEQLSPALLLITLGEQGMMLCRRGQKPFHISTVAQEVFDVSGAGDTVIASFTLAIAAGASPAEAAIVSNHAAGVVVGKVGTATVTPEELVESFKRNP